MLLKFILAVIIFISAVCADLIPANGYNRYGPYNGVIQIRTSSNAIYRITIDSCSNPNLNMVVGQGYVYYAPSSVLNQCVYIRNTNLQSINVEVDISTTTYVVVEKEDIKKLDEQIRELKNTNSKQFAEIFGLRNDLINLDIHYRNIINYLIAGWVVTAGVVLVVGALFGCVTMMIRKKNLPKQVIVKQEGIQMDDMQTPN